MPQLTVISWRDIPAQVTATDGTATSRRELDGRFLKAIDAAAMTAGLVDSDAYLDEWRRETRPCGDDLEAEIAAEVARLEAAHDRETLLRLTRAGGLRDSGSGSEPNRPGV
ncbi:MAG: virulence factor [Gaiella sp.]